MSRSVYLYDEAADLPLFLPFTQSRPIGELRLGAWLLRARVARTFGEVRGQLTSAHLAGFTEPQAPPVVAELPSRGERLVLRSTFVPAAEQEALSAAPRGSARLVDGNGVNVGALLADGDAWAGADALPARWPAVTLAGTRLEGVWQVIAELLPRLRADLAAVQVGRAAGRVPAGCAVLGDPRDLLIDEDVSVEPQVVLDLRGGPIWLRDGVEVRAFSRLQGPLVVGSRSRIVGGQVRESSIGPRCVVHGEVSNTTFLGYANKSHDGFLGHSLVGRWVNLGAGTITSNLKNTYGAIRLNLGEARIETGMQFLGALLGDHVKTAIGTMLPTGCTVGTGANLFGNARPGNAVPAFAWGTDEMGRRVACRMFLQTAGRVLPRREVAFDDATRAWLEAVWRHATGQPCD